MKNPPAKLWRQFVASLIVIGAALFGAAGTLDYWQAWLFLVVVAVSCVPVTLLMAGNAKLTENRARYGTRAEKRSIQKIIVLCLEVAATATYLVPALDRRFGWSNLPLWLSMAGDLLILAGMWMVYCVFKANSFGSATIEIADDQRVISTGPYAIVRHPMYAGASVYLAGASLALGSYWGLIPAILTTLCFVWRLFDEEGFLAQNLPGYREYCAGVRWRLIPGVF